MQAIERFVHALLPAPSVERLDARLQRVEVVASLPCYLEDNVDRQRGKGTFDASIRGLQRLNALGYGTSRELVAALEQPREQVVDALEVLPLPLAKRAPLYRNGAAA